MKLFPHRLLTVVIVFSFLAEDLPWMALAEIPRGTVLLTVVRKRWTVSQSWRAISSEAGFICCEWNWRPAARIGLSHNILQMSLYSKPVFFDCYIILVIKIRCFLSKTVSEFSCIHGKCFALIEVHDVIEMAYRIVNKANVSSEYASNTLKYIVTVFSAFKL